MTPNVYAGLESAPLENVPEAYQTTEIEVLFATDRTRADSAQGNVRYGAGRSPSMAFGRCVVSIGGGRMWQEVVHDSLDPRKSTKVPVEIMAREELVRFPTTLGPLVFVDGKPSDASHLLESRAGAEAEMIEALTRRLELADRKEVFLYVHGIHNGFDDAVYTMAQLWHMMGRVGVPVVYTWPANPELGPLRGYTHDRESGEFTVYHLREFIRVLAQSPNLERLHVIAHSRGTDVFTTALRELHLQMGGDWSVSRERLKFGQLILAAPDMDLEIAAQRLRPDMVTFVPERLTMYVSEHDKAIGIAEWLFSSITRLGRLRGGSLSKTQRGNLKNNMMDVIDAQISNPGPYGHSYFIDNPAVLSDVVLIFRDGLAAGAEHGRPLIRDESGMWILKDGYPNISSDEHAAAGRSGGGYVPRGPAGAR